MASPKGVELLQQVGRGTSLREDTQGQSLFLMGWKDIAKYLNMGVRTVQRYEQEHRLPVRRPLRNLRGPVLATKSELDLWMGSLPTRVFESRASLRSQPERDGLRTRINRARRLRFEMLGLRSELLGSIVALQKTIAISETRALVRPVAFASNDGPKP
jgi:hypothetical protein